METENESIAKPRAISIVTMSIKASLSRSKLAKNWKQKNVSVTLGFLKPKLPVKYHADVL